MALTWPLGQEGSKSEDIKTVQYLVTASDERRDAIVVFEPLSHAEFQDLSRRERISLLRTKVRQRVEQMLGELRSAGMADEVELCDGQGEERVPAGSVLVRATPRALQKISKLDCVAAVADLDTPLPMWLQPV
jgi:hypothetical protein